MASSLLLLLDDITAVLDDVAAMTKVAAKKTAGVLGDDLALNAQQVSGVRSNREWPVVWAVAKGSLVNKAILVPAALAISAVAPWAITPLLMIGGAYLCFEGFEKIAHRLLHRDDADERAHAEALRSAARDPAGDVAAVERDKVKGAIRTDFILSAEIIVIALGTVAGRTLLEQSLVLAAIALVMTVGVYGFVALIVKLDDAGLWLTQNARTGVGRGLGRAMLAGAPWLMRLLSIAGTAAMFLVGGGIVVHGWPWLHHLVEGVAQRAGDGWAGTLATAAGNALAGVAVGAAVYAVVEVARRLWPAKRGEGVAAA